MTHWTVRGLEKSGSQCGRVSLALTDAGQQIVDSQDLNLEPGRQEPKLCFYRSQVLDPAYALLDSGATHVLLPGHMLPKGANIFEVTINLAIGKEKARC